MIDLRTRESRDAPSKPVPVLRAAVTTAGWAAVVGVAPVVAIALFAWVADSRSGAPSIDAARVALQGWLLAHGVRLHTAGGSFGLAPLALTALIVRQLYRAGVNSARATGAVRAGPAIVVATAIAIVYGLIGATVALLGGTAGVWAGAVPAGLITGVVALLAAGTGALRVRGRLPFALPDPVRSGVIGGVVAAATILFGGAVAAGAMVGFSAGGVRKMFGVFVPGPWGGLLLLVVCLAYAPVVAIWAAAYLVGPGFAVGAGTSVSAVNVVLGPLPAFPLLAALPTGPAAGAAGLVLAVPLAAGLLAGVAVARGPAGSARWRITLGAAALAGLVAGVLLGLAAVVAGGPLGDGRLSAVGPSAWQVATSSALEVGVCALAAATVWRGLVAGRNSVRRRGDDSEPVRILTARAAADPTVPEADDRVVPEADDRTVPEADDRAVPEADDRAVRRADASADLADGDPIDAPDHNADVVGDSGAAGDVAKKEEDAQ